MAAPRALSAVLYADAGPSVGLGHVVRSCALAEALRDRGCDVLAIATLKDAPARAMSASFGFAWCNWDDAPRAEIVVVDSYKEIRRSIIARFGSALRVEISDGLERETSADLVIDGGPGSDGRVYRGSHLRAILAGTTYALVPRAFAAAAAGRREPRGVVSLGSGAPEQALRDAALAIQDARGWSVDVVVGPYTGSFEEKGVVVQSGLQPAQVAALFGRAGVGVVGGGQTLVQAFAAGLPVLAVALAENQRPQLEALQRMDALIAVVEPASLRIDATAALRAPLDLPALSARACGIIDGEGPRRAAEAIMRTATQGLHGELS